MNDCSFCKIIAGQIPAYVIDETQNLIVFSSLENHPLVVPKKHIKNIYEIDEATGSEVMNSLIKISRAVKQAQECDGIYIAQANEPAAGQDVFHIHFHVIPCWNGQPINKTERIDDGIRQATAEKIKNFIKNN